MQLYEVLGLRAQYLPENETARIRRGLRTPGYDGVRFDCFNREEAESIRACLSPDERTRVQFTWLFGGSPAEAWGNR